MKNVSVKLTEFAYSFNRHNNTIFKTLFLEVIKTFGNLFLDTFMLLLTDFRFTITTIAYIFISYMFYDHYNEV